LRHANVVILTDETEFARLLTACWQAERQAPNITVLNSDSWREQEAPTHDLVVVGPVRDGKITNVLRSLDPATAVILCAPADSQEFGQFAHQVSKTGAYPASAKTGRKRFCWWPANRCAARKLCRPPGKRSGTRQEREHATLGDTCWT